MTETRIFADTPFCFAKGALHTPIRVSVIAKRSLFFRSAYILQTCISLLLTCHILHFYRLSRLNSWNKHLHPSRSLKLLHPLLCTNHRCLKTNCRSDTAKFSRSVSFSLYCRSNNFKSNNIISTGHEITVSAGPLLKFIR